MKTNRTYLFALGVLFLFGGTTYFIYRPRKWIRVNAWLADRAIREIPPELNRPFKTAQGFRNYTDVLATFYQPNGFQLNPDLFNGKGDYPFLPLISSRKLSCDEVFEKWLSLNDKPKRTGPPPRNIPAENRNLFLMNNLSAYTSWYLNENQNQARLVWNQDLFRNLESKLSDPGRQIGAVVYGSDGLSVIESMKKLRPEGKGLVVGSQSPWVEAIALHYGATNVTTAEYANIQIEHKNVHYVHPIELAKNWRKYSGLDFAASFSSIEHSGLGRYGDAMDPWGDYWESQKVHCLLKPGGIFHVGIPIGQDGLAFNAHRIYGYIRWPIVAADFLVADLKPKEFEEMIGRLSLPNFFQTMIRLRKPE